jgi:hypothetical protein
MWLPAWCVAAEGARSHSATGVKRAHVDAIDGRGESRSPKPTGDVGGIAGAQRPTVAAAAKAPTAAPAPAAPVKAAPVKAAPSSAAPTAPPPAKAPSGVAAAAAAVVPSSSKASPSGGASSGAAPSLQPSSTVQQAAVVDEERVRAEREVLVCKLHWQIVGCRYYNGVAHQGEYVRLER